MRLTRLQKSKQVKQKSKTIKKLAKKFLKPTISRSFSEADASEEETKLSLPKYEEKTIQIIQSHTIYFLRETYTNQERYLLLQQELKAFYGEGLMDMKVHQTNTFIIMIGKLKVNGMANAKETLSKQKTLFVDNLQEKLISSRYKCNIDLDPNMITQTHLGTLNFC